MAAKALKDAKSDAELGIYVVPDVNGLSEPLTGQRIRDLAPMVDWVAPMHYHNILLQARRRHPDGWGQDFACRAGRFQSRSGRRGRLGTFHVGCRLDRNAIRGCALA